jgi:hypothetical protein
MSQQKHCEQDAGKQIADRNQYHIRLVMTKESSPDDDDTYRKNK